MILRHKWISVIFYDLRGQQHTEARSAGVPAVLYSSPSTYTMPSTGYCWILTPVLHCLCDCVLICGGRSGWLSLCFITPWQWKIQCNICKALTLLRLKRAKSTMNKQYKYQSNILMRTVMLLADENYVISVSQVVKKWREKVKTIHARNQQREKKSESTLRRFN